uniref:Uncharacterized protein n=1 Tax=Timema genevievae TaxID=629358 RepID=A0A7R9K3F6_TIMGE|nr:unnamed protein product [Timema genevievae]
MLHADVFAWVHAKRCFTLEVGDNIPRQIVIEAVSANRMRPYGEKPTRFAISTLSISTLSKGPLWVLVSTMDSHGHDWFSMGSRGLSSSSVGPPLCDVSCPTLGTNLLHSALLAHCCEPIITSHDLKIHPTSPDGNALIAYDPKQHNSSKYWISNIESFLKAAYGQCEVGASNSSRRTPQLDLVLIGACSMREMNTPQ